MVADLWDVAAPHTYKKPQPYPRPIKPAAPTLRHGDAAGRTPEQVKALLKAARSGLPDAPV
jgi:hypothetical protein